MILYLHICYIILSISNGPYHMPHMVWRSRPWFMEKSSFNDHGCCSWDLFSVSCWLVNQQNFETIFQFDCPETKLKLSQRLEIHSIHNISSHNFRAIKITCSALDQPVIGLSFQFHYFPYSNYKIFEKYFVPFLFVRFLLVRVSFRPI